MLTIENLASTFNSRGNMPMLHKHEEVPTINLPGGALHQQVQAFGNSLATELQRQGERQDRMLEVLLQDRMGNSLDNKRLRYDSELFGRHFPMRGERSLPIMDGRMQFKRLRSSSSSELAITAGGEDEDIPRRSAAPQALPPAPAAAPAAPEAAPAAPPTAIDLLGMLETRDSHKKLQAKIAKAKAKVDEERRAKALAAEEEGGKAKDVDSTPKENEQPKAKAKAKAKAKPKAKSKAKDVDSTPKKKEQPTAKGKANKPKEKGVEAKSGDPKANESAAKGSADTGAKTPGKCVKAEGGHKHTPVKAANPNLEPDKAKYQVEASRDNIQVRVPKKGGGFLNKQFLWGKPDSGRKYRNLAAAQAAAKKWVADGCM